MTAKLRALLALSLTLCLLCPAALAYDPITRTAVAPPEWVYESDDLQAFVVQETWTYGNGKQLVFYIVDVCISDPSQLARGFAKGKYTASSTGRARTSVTAESVGAVVAVTLVRARPVLDAVYLPLAKPRASCEGSEMQTSTI